LRIVGTDEQRREIVEAWNAMAPGWGRRADEIDEAAAQIQEWLIGALEPQPGDVVLDLAAGPGSAGFAAAPLVGESGRVISIDVSPAMVEVARSRARARGITNVDFAVTHADAIELEDDSVDGVVCRFGYMLMPDPAAAFAETRRVLRPGGRLALAVWRSAERNPWVSIAGRMLVGRGLVPPPEPGAPGMFALAGDEQLRTLLQDAGFAVERLEDVGARFEHRDVDDYVFRGRDTGGLFARAWDDASEEQRAEMTAELEERFAQFRTNDGYVLPGVALCVLAI